MKMTLAEPKYLKDSIAILSDLVREGHFKINKDAIELVGMDPANVAMVIFKLFSSMFIEYDVPENTEISINLADFNQILRRAKQNDSLTLELTGKNQLGIKLRGATTRTFTLALLAVDEHEQKIPNLTFPAVVNTSSSIFSDAIEDAEVVGESVAFTAEPEKFTVTAEGDQNRLIVEVKSGDGTTITTDDMRRSKYSIEYLKKMATAAKLTDEVQINFSQDYPLKLDYKVIDKVSLSFILAPRVDND